MSPLGEFEDYCDRVYVGTDSKHSYATMAMPLIPVLELRFQLEEKKVYGYRAENPYNQWGRRYRASWVIEDGKLYFKDVEGSLEGSELSYQLLFSNYQDAEGNPTLVPATWFSGKFLTYFEHYHYIKRDENKEYAYSSKVLSILENGVIIDEEIIIEEKEVHPLPF